MTSLVAWAGVDTHGPASIYIATDSRISWGAGSTWDNGRKVFASRSRPELFGYVGDVLFPSLILGQIADAPASPATSDPQTANLRLTKVIDLIKCAFRSLPDSERRPFQIAYGWRVGDGMKADFRLSSLSWEPRAGWSINEETIPAASDSVVVWGSGSKAICRWKERWNRSSEGGTSRAIFSALCDAIGSGQDPLSGGAPQVVGLYRIGPARTIGIVKAAQPFIYGLPVEAADRELNGLEWRNHLFERCDAAGTRLAAAQAHHSPKGLGLTIGEGAAQHGAAADGAAPRR